MGTNCASNSSNHFFPLEQPVSFLSFISRETSFKRFIGHPRIWEVQESACSSLGGRALLGAMNVKGVYCYYAHVAYICTASCPLLLRVRTMIVRVFRNSMIRGQLTFPACVCCKPCKAQNARVWPMSRVSLAGNIKDDSRKLQNTVARVWQRW